MTKNTWHPDTAEEHLKNNDYQDTGCELFAHCLSCPRPTCIYDELGGIGHIRKQAQDLQVMTAIQEANLTAEEAAKTFSITVRTVSRIKQRYRKEGLAGITGV